MAPYLHTFFEVVQNIDLSLKKNIIHLWSKYIKIIKVSALNVEGNIEDKFIEQNQNSFVAKDLLHILVGSFDLVHSYFWYKYNWRHLTANLSSLISTYY